MSTATPATQLLQRQGVQFRVHQFAVHADEGNYGLAAAEALQVDPDRVFKTLLVRVEGVPTPGVVVGIVPVSGSLSLKELAAAVGGKRADMCDPNVAQRLTGYVVGGISPFGQKRSLPTVIDSSCSSADTIFVSGGRRGLDIEIAPSDLITVLAAIVAPVGVLRTPSPE